MKHFHVDLTKRRSWREDASNPADWEAWDRAWRKKLGWRAGLTFWRKTNVPGRRLLIARHWPHRLCWSWGVDVSWLRPERGDIRRFAFYASTLSHSVDLYLWFWSIDYHWQNYDWMVAVHLKGSEPKIYWKHHLEHAAPVGTA